MPQTITKATQAAKATQSTENTITEKLKTLNDKIEWFYGDDFSLDQATEKYKEAAKLAQDIEKDLSGLKNEIEIISEDFTKE